MGLHFQELAHQSKHIYGIEAARCLGSGSADELNRCPSTLEQELVHARVNESTTEVTKHRNRLYLYQFDQFLQLWVQGLLEIDH